MTTGGNETVLHDFTFGADGGNPSASLIDVNGTLYSTTKRAVPRASEPSFRSRCNMER